MYEFSRQYRLVNKQDFQSVFAKSKKVAQHSLLALYQSNQLTHARIGIIISKNHVKLAVHRNRLRRLVRESFRQQKDALKGLDIIILMRSKWSPLDNTALRDDLDHLWLKLMPSSPTA